jgi:hypothetical protein
MGRMNGMRAVPLRRLPVFATALLLAGTGACGSGDTPGSGAGTASSSATSASADYPITLTRTGGIAGFADRVVVTEDGRATAAATSGATSKGGPCLLDEAALEELSALARPVTGTATTTPAHPDDLVVVLETPHGSARLTETQLSGPASLVPTLLGDLAKAPDERALCR